MKSFCSLLAWLVITSLGVCLAQGPVPPVEPTPLSPVPQIPSPPMSGPTAGDSFILELLHVQGPQSYSIYDRRIAAMERYEGVRRIHYIHEARMNAAGSAEFTMSVNSVARIPTRGKSDPEFQRALRASKVPGPGYTLFLHSVGEGTVFPMPNGMLFRAIAMDAEKKQTTVEFIPPGSFPGAPPIGERCRLLLFAPHATTLGGEYSPVKLKNLNRRVTVKHPETGLEIESPVVDVALYRSPSSTGMGTSILSRKKEEMELHQELTIGSFLQLGGIKYPVKNIVLPDPEKKIIGWVELEMPEFDEEGEVARWKEEQAEWVKRWGPIVRP